MVVTVQQN